MTDWLIPVDGDDKILRNTHIDNLFFFLMKSITLTNKVSFLLHNDYFDKCNCFRLKITAK